MMSERQAETSSRWSGKPEQGLIDFVLISMESLQEL